MSQTFDPIFKTVDKFILSFRSFIKSKKNSSTPSLSLSLEENQEPKEKFSLVLSYTNFQNELYEAELKMDELSIMVLVN